MAWLSKENRLTQCYVATVAALNDCGLRPNGAEVKQWIREELPKVQPPITEVEMDTVLAGFLQDRVQYHSDDPEKSQRLFLAHPVFGKRGHKVQPVAG
jgi:hypothetical protein